MSTTVAKPDAPPIMFAVVLTKERVVRQGGLTFHGRVNEVVGLRMMSPSVVASGASTFNAGADTKLIPAGSYKVGDVVEG